MSAQFFQSSTPQENQSIKVNDATIRGACSVAEGLTVNSLVVSTGSTQRAVTYKPLPVNYTQTVSAGTAVVVTGADECFDITTFALTTAAGGQEAFAITHSGVGANDFAVLTQVSYSGSYNVNGAANFKIISVSAGSIEIAMKNWGTGSLNGAHKFRIKLYHNAA